MTPDDVRHGTEAGHEQHNRDGEEACPACYDAKLRASRRRTKRKTMGYHYTVPSAAARARIRQWKDGGATWGEIADHAGIAESRAWEIYNNNSPVIYPRTAASVLRAKGWPVTTLGLTRRVRALVRLGWSIPRIAEACDVHGDTILNIRRRQPDFASKRVRAGIVAGYERLSMSIPEGEAQQERAGITRARNYAEKAGWLPPLAWDDIDNPDERPAHDRINERAADAPADHVIVERFMSHGEYDRHCNVNERMEIIRRWVLEGRSQRELMKITGWNVDRDIRLHGHAHPATVAAVRREDVA